LQSVDNTDYLTVTVIDRNDKYVAISQIIDQHIILLSFLPRGAMHKRGLCRHAVCVCVCVCVSVTFVHYVKTNKDIFNFFSPSGSHTILVFPHQTRWQYSDWNPLLPNGGVECRNRDSEPTSGVTACVNAATGRCCKRGRLWSTASVSQVMTHRWQ